MELNEDFVNNMSRFIDIFMEDREENKLFKKETRDDLTDIKMNITRLITQSESDEKIREDTKEDYKELKKELKRIPTEKEKTNIENRVISLEKLKPKLYMIIGGLSLLAIAIPIVAKIIGGL